MYAAGRRTVRPPVRFQDYATERIAQHLAPIQSTPTDVTERKDNVFPTAERRPTTDRKTQLSWMQQELINVTHDLEQFQLELDHLENQQQGATGISPIRDHPPTDSGSVRARSSASGVTGQQTQFPERENGASRPSLQDIRAMNRLAGHDPLQQFDLRGPLPRSGRPDVKKPAVTTLTDFPDFPVVSAPLPQGSALSSQERPVRAQPQQDLRASDWSVLEADTLQTQRQAFALSTQANHRSSFRSYLGFCEFFRKTPIPASPHLLSCYVQFLSRSVKSVATISHHLSAVKLLHQFHGFYDLDLSGFELQQTLKGLKKTLRHQPREHHPVTPEFLLRVHPLINHSDPTDATVWAVILVGFFTFLRRSNLAPASVKSFDPNKNLCRRDISVAPEGLLIRVRWTKTIQANERRLEIPVLAIPNSPLCPVRAYVNMVRLIPGVPSSSAFQLPASSNPARPLTISALDKAFARLVVAAGLPSRFHTLHDLRRGGYTFAFEAGVPRELRRQHGDWRSDADLLYLHLPLAERLKLPAAMRGLLLQRLASHDTTLPPT
ncbi:uncharacterized protein LOC144917132 [Branchiostoma floridae x Branchiostoma belcheri]